MKITVGQLVNSFEALKRMDGQDLPIHIAFRIGNIIEELNTYLETYEKNRQKLVKKYGEETEDGNYEVKPNTENQKKFIEELNTILQEEVNMEFTKIDMDELAEAGVKLKPTQVNAIKWIFSG